MRDQNEFEPHLGLVRASGARRGRSFLSQVLRAKALASNGRHSASRKASAFHGNRMGVGCGVGRVLASRDKSLASLQRRVIVKITLSRLNVRGLSAGRLHLRYIQRDGVTLEGCAGQLYSAEQDCADGKAFQDRAEAAGDTRQFRFIVSAEDGAQYDDLKPLTRRLMSRMEQDLDTRLDWVAVDHHDTGHPHTHILVRGRNDRGGELIIAREYLTHGVRVRAAELVSLDLGPRTDFEIGDRLRNEVGQERLTSLDEALRRDQHNGLVVAAQGDAFHTSLRIGRLQMLARLGLAEPATSTHWRLAPDLETVLGRMEERDHIIKTLHRDLAEKGVSRAVADLAIYAPQDANARPVIGRLVRRGQDDELKDRHYLVLDGVDGRAHYVGVGPGDGLEDLPEGAVVSIMPKRAEARDVDRTIADVAAANDGRYSVDVHLRHDRNARESFAEAHVRRLKALRRLDGLVDQAPDGTFIIAPDHLQRVKAFEQSRLSQSPVQVHTLSSLSVNAQLDVRGATWLDRQLTTDSPEPLRDHGFGREVRLALERRRLWLIDQGLARDEQDRTLYRADLLATLERRDLSRAAGQLARDLNLGYVEAEPGHRIEGVYRRSVDLASGRFAVIERSRDFTLVPWRPVLERHLGKPVLGMIRGDGISWTLRRQREGPSIS